MRVEEQRVGRFVHPGRTAAIIGVKADDVIADFGAGSGHHTFHFASLLDGNGRVYAIDVQQDLLRRIKNEAQGLGLKNVEVVHGDVERPHGSRLADKVVDLVLMSNLLFQLNEKALAFNEAWRILKPAGALAIIEWSDSFGGMGPAQKHVVSKDNAILLAREHGFSVTREFQTGANHYGLLLKPIPQVRL